MYCTHCGKNSQRKHICAQIAAILFPIGFFFPLVGLFCFLGWRKSRPLRGASCGVGAVFGGLLFLSMAYFFAIFYFFLLMIGAGVTIGMV